MAATSVGEIGLDLVVNQNQFKTQMAGITGLAKKAGMALAAAFSIKKVVDFGKSCLELGSDLAEVPFGSTVSVIIVIRCPPEVGLDAESVFEVFGSIHFV